MEKIARIFFVFLALLLSLFSANQLVYDYNHTEPKIVSKALDLPIENATVKESVENHGWFGDGETFITLSFPNGSLADKIKAKPDWEPLPLTRKLNAFLYGDHYYSSPIYDEENNPRFPAIINGYYYFLDKQNGFDRQSGVENPHDDKNLFSRYSYNVIVALYDTDTNRLYYCEYDT